MLCVYKLKTYNILHHTATKELPEVIAMQEDTIAKRRKRKAEQVDPTIKAEERKQLLKMLTSLPELVGPFPSPLDMLKAFR